LLQQMAPLAEGDEQRALVALARGIALFWGLANDVAADDVLAEAEAEAEAEAGSPAWQAELRATRATLRSQAGRHRQALALLDDLPDPIPSDRAAVQAALAEAFALPAVGRAEDALKVIDAATDVHGRLGRQLTLYQSGLLLAARSMALVDLGRLGEAAELASLGLHVSLDSGDTSARGYFAATLGWVRLNQGLLDTAQRHYREAAACFRAVGHRGPRRWALGGLLFAAALARDRTTAAEAADTLAEVGPHPAALFEQRIDRGRAWLALAEGQPVVARRTMEDIAERARALGHVVEEAATLHDLARIGQARAVTARLEELAAQTDGELVPLQAADAAARASGDPARLGDVAEGFASLGAFLWAAESASGAAEAAAKMGDQRAAVRWARRATELAERCQGVSVPVLGPSEAPVALTRREREIALLAASGEPSRAIAERLYVSVRTVDNHLARIYTKLGVGGRAELAAALGLA
jgi:DNA-binding CsgD family transcriptional regulator